MGVACAGCCARAPQGLSSRHDFGDLRRFGFSAAVHPLWCLRVHPMVLAAGISWARPSLMLLPRVGNPFLSTGGKYRSEQCHDMKSDMGSSGRAGEVQLNLQELRHAKLGTVAPMIFHWSCALRLRSRIATRSHFIAIRLSGLVTAAHKRMHPIALSYLGGDWRFITSPCSLVPVPLH